MKQAIVYRYRQYSLIFQCVQVILNCWVLIYNNLCTILVVSVIFFHTFPMRYFILIYTWIFHLKPHEQMTLLELSHLMWISRLICASLISPQFLSIHSEIIENSRLQLGLFSRISLLSKIIPGIYSCSKQQTLSTYRG